MPMMDKRPVENNQVIDRKSKIIRKDKRRKAKFL